MSSSVWMGLYGKSEGDFTFVEKSDTEHAEQSFNIPLVRSCLLNQFFACDEMLSLNINRHPFSMVFSPLNRDLVWVTFLSISDLERFAIFL